MRNQERFLYLLDRYTSDTISHKERDELFYLISSGDTDHLLGEYFNSNLHKENLSQVNLSPYRAQEILHKILNSEKHTSRILPQVFRKKNIFRWSAAASLAGLIVFAAYFLFQINHRNNPEIAFTKHFTKNLYERKNTTSHPVKIQMEDGSFATLQPGSEIKIPDHFSAAKREVYMDGEIFFEITKNPNRPFFVYNKDLVTHVLGTSFNVRIDDTKKQVEVSVVTGKVQVYENKKGVFAKNSKKRAAVIIMPNQKVVYNEDDKHFTATLVSNPLPVVTNKDALQAISFVFDETRLSQVLSTMEKIYGIEIVVQNETIYDLLFTGNVTDYDLYAKLDIICESIKASYEINGTKILIKSKDETSL